MEVTRARLLVLSALLAVSTWAVKVRPPLPPPTRTERWMESALPTEVAGLRMIPSRENPAQSYRATDSTYQDLKPYGIVCRVFGTPRDAVDATVIGGDAYESLHDPESCFPLFGWTVLSSRTVPCRTRTQGDVPLRVMRVRTPDNGERLVAYCYRSSLGLCATRREFAWGWNLGALRLGRPQEGAFYRFYQLCGPVSEGRLVGFVADYLDVAHDRSGGVL